MTAVPCVELKNLTYHVPGQGELFADVNLQLMEGDRFGLIGPNGSGKTTLLHLIMGLVKPQKGEIRIFGRPMLSEADFIQARRQVGLLFQNADDQLFCPTVLEDVAFGPLNLGKSPEEAEKIARKTLSDLELEGFEKRITAKLSGGEKKLVSLATLLAMQPKVLLLDEPTTGLDEATRKRILEVLNNLQLSTIIVSHEFDFLCRTSTSIYGFSDKSLHYEGDSSILHPHYHKHSLGNLPHSHS
ncbi:MAG: energy-coupling factor ABC transporter ATP-binding protein [Desulfobulbaceae bacterium]|nr:energy-coupling factor ABC transporter ATP-binding protein [Desulfobulbaceae bacterium]